MAGEGSQHGAVAVVYTCGDSAFLAQSALLRYMEARTSNAVTGLHHKCTSCGPHFRSCIGAMSIFILGAQADRAGVGNPRSSQ